MIGRAACVAARHSPTGSPLSEFIADGDHVATHSPSRKESAMAEATETQEKQDVVDRLEEMEAMHSSPSPDMRQTAGPDQGFDQEPGGKQLVEKAAQAPKAAQAMSAEERMDALAWLLTDGSEEEISATQTWEINVGSDDRPVLIEWTIKPLDSDTMNEIRQRARQEAGMNRQARRQGLEPELDVRLLNLRMVAAATVSPDLQQAAVNKGVAAADPLFGPVKLLEARFRHKPGLVEQIAARVMLFSGYDDVDVRRQTPDLAMMQATKN
jgi:Phage XkdN-like tail assembly chaperone protein, TAC